MNKKIFNAIWIVAIVVFLASLIFIMSVSYNYFSGVQLKQLKTEAELASQGVSLSGLDYLNSLEAKDYRITWIDADGTVTVRFYMTMKRIRKKWKTIWSERR